MPNIDARLRRLTAALAFVLLADALCPAQDDEAFKKLAAVDYSKTAVGRDQFKDRDIQQYLKEQPWYKPDPAFTNASLNATERANLDLTRELEAEKHDQIEPGDLRWWQTKPMTEEKLGTHSAAEWQVLR